MIFSTNVGISHNCLHMFMKLICLPYFLCDMCSQLDLVRYELPSFMANSRHFIDPWYRCISMSASSNRQWKSNALKSHESHQRISTECDTLYQFVSFSINVGSYAKLFFGCFFELLILKLRKVDLRCSMGLCSNTAALGFQRWG